MNVYFELADSVVEMYGQKYFALYGVRKSSVIAGPHRQLMLHSNRVWAEDDTGVRYLKNRFEDIYDTQGVTIDTKEFFWIKMRSQTV